MLVAHVADPLRRGSVTSHAQRGVRGRCAHTERSVTRPDAGPSGAKQREQRSLLRVEVEAACTYDPAGAGPEVGQRAAAGVRVDDGGRDVRGTGHRRRVPEPFPDAACDGGASTRFASASLRGWSYSASATAADRAPQVRKSSALNSGQR